MTSSDPATLSLAKKLTPGRIAAVTALVALLMGLAAASWMLFQIHADYQAPGPLDRGIHFNILQGQSLRGAAEDLKSAGVVEDARRFYISARLFGGKDPIRAGEYNLPAHISMKELLALLQSGKVVQHRLTVPEGSTVADILELLAAAEPLAGDVRQPPQEGSLFPDTYFYTRDEQTEALISRMRRAMDQELLSAWENRDPTLPLASVEEALALASIVEKETALPEERGRIAAVFLNRLMRGMRLQSDPTVIYAIAGGQGLDRPLSSRDLDHPSPYNTYRHHGLPPGPICNPGRESIRAVLNPISSQELYFVADGSGGHVFAETLEAHNRNVAQWRRVQAQRRAEKN